MSSDAEKLSPHLTPHTSPHPTIHSDFEPLSCDAATTDQIATLLSPAVGVKMGSILVNSYGVNLYGIIEGMISNVAICNGRGLNHYALDNCNTSPLSMRPVYEQMIKVHRQLDQVIAKTVAYVGILFGLDEGVQQLTYNSLLAFALGPLSKSSAYLDQMKVGGDAAYLQNIASSFKSVADSGTAGIAGMVGGFVQAVFGSLHGMFFVYDELVLKYLKSLIQNRNSQAHHGGEVYFFAFSNLLFDSIALGPMKNTLITPQYRMCQTYSQLTGDSQSATGKVIFHSCASIIEVFYASMQVVSSTITLAAVSDCVCNINANENEPADQLEQRCRHKLPEALHPQLVEYMATRGRSNSAKMCATLVTNFKNVLLKIPTQAKTHINLALTHAVDVPVQLMNFLQIDGLQADSCTQYQTNLDVVTMIPRPISAFQKCALLPSCRSKCREEIDWFYAKKLQVATPDVSPIRSALMAFIPAWVSQIENLQEQFMPLAVQDYGEREGCDHYIVVVGRPLYHAQVADAAWTMYVFCYMHATASLAVTAKFLLPETQYFVLNNHEHASRQNSNSRGQPMLVSEVLLAPLGHTDKGALVVVHWDNARGLKENNNNAIFEAFVDSMGTVHESWLLRSRDIVDNSVCSNLHASIMASCSAHIVDIEHYNLVNDDVNGRTSFLKIALLPQQQPLPSAFAPDRDAVAVYTIIGLLQMFVQYTDPDESGAGRSGVCQANLEFTWVQRRPRGNTAPQPAPQQAPQCMVHAEREPGSDTQNMTVYALLRDNVLRHKELLLSSTPLGTLMLITTRQDAESQKMLRLVTYMDGSGGSVSRLMFRVQQEDSLTLHVDFVSANAQRHVEYNEYETGLSMMYAATMLHDAAHSSTNQANEDNRIVFTVQYCNKGISSNTAGFIHEFTMHLPGSADMTTFRTRQDQDKKALQFAMESGNGIASTVSGSVQEKCDYMNCKACSTRRLKAACDSAQKCAIVNCVGTVINPNNVLCVLGSLVKEVHEVYLTNIDAMWFGLVETSMSILKLSKVSGMKHVVYLESVSNVVNNALCETKDIYAAGSAVLPSLFFSVYVALSGNKKHTSAMDVQNPGFAKAQQTFSPGVQLKNAAIISSITQTIYQFALINIHLMHASSKLLLCTIDKFAEFTGGYVNIVNHDTLSGGTIDFCMSQNSNNAHRLTPQTDEQIIRDSIAVGAVGDSVVEVSIAGIRIPTGTFFIDTDKAVVWVANYNKIMWLILTNVVFDSVLGVLYGISRLVGVFERSGCQPRPVEISAVLRCVCQDTPFRIHRARRKEVAADGALWCTGLLKMVNTEGEFVYVHNPFSLDTLASDLHVAGQKYIDCIVSKNENLCVSERDSVFTQKYIQHFTPHKVSPLAVLTRCRENYNAKTWDEGVFGLFNIDLLLHIQAAQHIPTGAALQTLRTEVDGHIREDNNDGIVHQCLIAGPHKNRIQACMGLTYTHHAELARQERQQNTAPAQAAQIPQDFSAVGYYVYDIAEPASSPPDACEYLSSASFLTDSRVAQCRGEDTSGICGFTASRHEDTCRIGQSTLSYEHSIQTNIIDEFRISRELVYDEAAKTSMDAQVSSKYSMLKSCATDYAEGVTQDILPNIQRIVEALDLTLTTGEGDILHQFVDCIMLGANTKTILAPADTGGVLEDLMYSRHANGTSRDFDLPCAGTYVRDARDSAEAPPLLQKTCGSDTRIAVMAYVTRTIVDTDDGGLHKMLAKLITDKISSITNIISDHENYGCLGPVTGLHWRNIGSEPPPALHGGRLLEHGQNSGIGELSNYLQTRPADTPVTSQVWAQTGITDLGRHDYILAGNDYFQPKPDVSWRHCCAVAGECQPGESDFESNLPDVDTVISVDHIVTMLTQSLQTIERDSITGLEVCSFMFERTPRTYHTLRTHFVPRVITLYGGPVRPPARGKWDCPTLFRCSRGGS